MEITVEIPQVLCRYAGDRSKLTVRADTVQNALLELERDYPALHQCVCDERGVVRRHINVFVNNDFMRDRDGLATRLVAGDVVSIFQAVSGG